MLRQSIIKDSTWVELIMVVFCCLFQAFLFQYKKKYLVLSCITHWLLKIIMNSCVYIYRYDSHSCISSWCAIWQTDISNLNASYMTNNRLLHMPRYMVM